MERKDKSGKGGTPEDKGTPTPNPGTTAEPRKEEEGGTGSAEEERAAEEEAVGGGKKEACG